MNSTTYVPALSLPQGAAKRGYRDDKKLDESEVISQRELRLHLKE